MACFERITFVFFLLNLLDNFPYIDLWYPHLLQASNTQFSVFQSFCTDLQIFMLKLKFDNYIALIVTC